MNRTIKTRQKLNRVMEVIKFKGSIAARQETYRQTLDELGVDYINIGGIKHG